MHTLVLHMYCEQYKKSMLREEYVVRHSSTDNIDAPGILLRQSGHCDVFQYTIESLTVLLLRHAIRGDARVAGWTISIIRRITKCMKCYDCIAAIIKWFWSLDIELAAT